MAYFLLCCVVFSFAWCGRDGLSFHPKKAEARRKGRGRSEDDSERRKPRKSRRRPKRPRATEEPAFITPKITPALRQKDTYSWEDMSDGIQSLLISHVVVDPTKPTRLYAAADGIVYRSDNSGLDWKPLARFQGTTRSASPAQIDRTEEIRVLKERILDEKIEDLAAEYGETWAEEQRDRLEREAEEEAEDQLGAGDGGLQDQGGGRLRRQIYRIVVAPSRPQRVLVTTDGGAFLSDDYGKTFRTIFRGRRPEEGDVRSAVIDPIDHKRLWLGTQSGLWYSNDSGKTWRTVYNKLRRMEIREIRLDPFKPKKMYIATNRALFVSPDRGQTFNEPLTLPSGQRRITTLAVLNTKPVTVVVGTGGGLYISNRQGGYQQLDAQGIGDRDIVYLTSSPNAPKNLYLVNTRGVFVSFDKGKNFSSLRDGMLSNTIRFLSVSSKNPLDIWAATEYGLLNWTKQTTGKVSTAQLKRFQAQLDREPTAPSLVLSALRFMKLRDSLGGIQDRFRARALLPELRIRFNGLWDRDINFLLVGQPIPVRINEARALRIEGILQWNLGNMIQDQREIRLVTQLRELRKIRDRVMTRVVRLFFARRRLQFQVLQYSKGQNFYRYLRLRLKLDETTAQLDAFTGGRYSTRLQRLQALLRKERRNPKKAMPPPPAAKTSPKK
jgi:hypothetical protein